MTDNTLFEKYNKPDNEDFGLYYCGKRIKTKNHVYGPEIRSHFLIVFVENGKAVLFGKNKKTVFGDGDMLVMFPGEKIFYRAKTDWTIKWIGISGESVESIIKKVGITRENPIFRPKNPREISKTMSCLYDMDYDGSLFSSLKIRSLLYEFFSLLFFDEKEKADIVDSAIEIIRYNYNNNLSIDKIAKGFFVSTAHFSRLFKKKTGISPKKYILEIRIKKAKELLKETDCSVKEIAVTAGFDDPLYFSRIFKKITGLSPLNFRKEMR